MNTLLIVVLIGLLGGAVRGFLGYKNQADKYEPFDWLKFVKSMLRSAIAGSVLVYTTIGITTNNPTILYISAFFLSVGADVVMKEGYKAVVKKGYKVVIKDGLLRKLSDWIR